MLSGWPRGTRGGDEFLFEHRASLIADALAEPPSLIGVMVRAALEDRLGALAPTLPGATPALARKSLSEFFELVSHELGNAVTPLEISASQLGDLVPTGDRRLKRIGDVAARLRTFASSLHTLLPMEGEPFAPFDLLLAVSDALAQTATERNGHLRPVVAVPAVTLLGPQKRFTLALVQLIRNAAQAAGDRTLSLWVHGEPVASGLELRLEDDGPGVPNDLVGSLFDRGVSGRGGSGLGLAIVREVVEREMGGSVRYQPGASGGAVFVIGLPKTAVVLG